LKLQAVCAVRFTRKRIIANTCYISSGVGVKRFQTAKSTIKVTQGHCYRCHSV